MSVFTDAEKTYLDNQPLGRLATIGPDGAPQTRPVGFTYNHDLDTIDIGGRDLTASQKYRNILADVRVSFVVDDLASVTPWKPRGIEIRGTAEALVAAPLREGFTADLIRIHPARVLAWGLDTDAYAAPHARNVPGRAHENPPRPVDRS
jgi:pyridoxamine 5'-phosphate oxidase family protein